MTMSFPRRRESRKEMDSCLRRKGKRNDKGIGNFLNERKRIVNERIRLTALVRAAG